MSVDLATVYRDLHQHPELAMQERRTAGVVVDHLGRIGFEVITGVGGTGVVGVLRNGTGPTVLLRADMDGLPVREETRLPYASTDRGIDRDGNEVPLMHACGHDVHVTCLLGAADALAQRPADWAGTVVVVFQPAEEVGEGARAMIDDGLYERIPRPEVVLGQHVGPLPAGLVGVHPGPAFAAADGLRIRMFGRGGHGSRPEAVIDPVVMAAATVMRLQTVVSREVDPAQTTVVTVGYLNSGTKSNIVPDEAVMGLSVRTPGEPTRSRVIEVITRIVNAEAVASGAERAPQIEQQESLPAVVNDIGASARVVAAFTAAFGADRVIDPGAVSGSEDVGAFSDELGIPIVYWILGGADAVSYAAAVAAGRVERDIPSNHSPQFAPVIEPTLETGVSALTAAALEWLGR